MPAINPQILQAGLETAQTTLGLGMGLMLERHQDRRQLRQQQALQGIQIQGQKELSDYNYAKQLEMWKATNYQAQVEQLKQAGLNPGMLYGMSGGGGTTTGTGSPGSVTGGTAPVGEASSAHMINQMLQMGIMRAQKENIEADTAKKQAETTKTSGVDTKLATQEITNKEAQEKLTRMQTAWQEIQNSIARQTIVDSMKIIENTAKKQEQEITSMKLQNQLTESQMKDRITITRYEAIGAALQNILTKAETDKTRAEIGNINQDTKNKIQQVARSIQEGVQEWRRIGVEMQKADILRDEVTELIHKDLSPNLKDMLQGIIIPIGGGRKALTPVTGFHDRSNK